MALRIYLAGPDVFLANAREVGKRKKELCRKYGFEGLFPLDQDDAVKEDPAEIFIANCSLMKQADIGLFNLTPFRGPSADTGTVFELGYMYAKGKLVHGYANTSAIYQERVDTVQGPLVERDGRRWDIDGHSVEDFGLIDNLMVVRAIQEAGGTITIVGENAFGSLASFRAFEASLEMLREK